MGYLVYPEPTASSGGLNSSQIFTTSGTFTVPAGVTSVFIRVRGGNGSDVGLSTSANVNTAGASGGTTTVGNYSAAGGVGAAIRTDTTYRALGKSLTNGVVVEGYQSVTPGQSLTVTIGSGTGAHAVISWSSS